MRPQHRIRAGEDFHDRSGARERVSFLVSLRTKVALKRVSARSQNQNGCLPYQRQRLVPTHDSRSLDLFDLPDANVTSIRCSILLVTWQSTSTQCLSSQILVSIRDRSGLTGGHSISNDSPIEFRCSPRGGELRVCFPIHEGRSDKGRIPGRSLI
jgi:hypothetical protein